MSEPAEPQLSDVLRDRRQKLGRIRDAGIEPFPHEFSQREDVVGLEDRHPVLEVEPRAGLDLVPDRRQRVPQGENGDQKLLSTTASASASSSARRTVPSRLAWALLA